MPLASYSPQRDCLPRKHSELRQLVNSYGLIDRYLLVVLFQRLTIFRDLNGVAIENADREMLAPKLHRAIGRGNPSFQRGMSAPIAALGFQVSSFKRTHRDAI